MKMQMEYGVVKEEDRSAFSLSTWRQPCSSLVKSVESN